MYLRKIHIENYRLLKNVDVIFDRSLTLFVGKNNTGKTSVMELLSFLASDRTTLSFDDYPLTCRNDLYKAIINYWSEHDLIEYQNTVPIPKFTLTFDYADGGIGNLDTFVIDLEENEKTAVVEVSFNIPIGIEKTLDLIKKQYDAIISDDSELTEQKKCISWVVRDNFKDLFSLNVSAVNPLDLTDTRKVNKKDLQNLFNLKSIKAERNMDESDIANNNPIGKIMNRLFDTELNDVDVSLKPSMEKLNRIVQEATFNLNSEINTHMDAIVASMINFGYPSGEDLKLRSNTKLSLRKQIIEDSQLTYVSGIGVESLPESHNGLGYKNLIKISMELHDYVRTIKEDLTKLPLLLIEEPEAHMHPQLQTTFVAFLTGFLNEISGENQVQVIMTSHSSHVANTVPFKQVRYILREKSEVLYKSMEDFTTNIKLPDNLAEKKRSKAIDKDRNKRTEFLQKYMKLSYCDLYFCDKVILVEGASERLLLPDMIRKCNENGDFKGVDIPLPSQYYTIIEVGGAYAHHFYDLLKYLRIPALIITDIDYVKGAHNLACNKDDAERSSNGAINNWCRTVFKIKDNSPVPIEKILSLSEDQHSIELLHLEFQKEENGFFPRSLEDAIMNCNRKLFNIDEDSNPNFEKQGIKKTDFALKMLIENEFSSYKVPSYIRDGLIWLNNQTRIGEH